MRMNVNTRKPLILILALALMLSVFVLPGQVVQAQTVYVSGPNVGTIGSPITVTIGISPAVQIANGFDVNVNYDASGLQYNGYTAHISTMTPSVTAGSGLIILGYQGGNATAGNVFSLSFTPIAAGNNWRITVGDATYGLGTAAGGATLGIQVQAAAAPPPVQNTPTPLPTVGPTPQPTVPIVTLPEQTAGPTEAQATEPESGEPLVTFYTFDGKPLVASDQDIPEDRYVFDYVREEITVEDETVQVLRADGRPRLYWLESPDGEADMYLYWQAEDRYLPYRLFRPIGDQFVILPPPSDAALPDGFAEAELELDGEVYPAFRATPARYRLLGSDPDETDLPDLYVVYARVQRPAEPAAEETPAEAAETPEGTETEAETTEAAEPAQDAGWEDGEFYFFDREREMLFPLGLMLMQVPEITPTPEPTPAPTAAPTVPPTEPPPVETIPVDAEPVLNLFGYEYGLWKTIIFILGFLLLLTWLILLIRSLGRKSREVERAKIEAEKRRIAARQKRHATDPYAKPAETRPPAGDTAEEAPIRIEERPQGPEPQLIVPPAEPLTVDRDDQDSAAERDAFERPETAPKRERPANLPEMPTLKSPRPAPLPTIRNAQRTHADEMVLRPLPAEPVPEPETVSEPVAETAPVVQPERPVIRRIEIESRKPKIRKPERPVIDDQDNSEI